MNVPSLKSRRQEDGETVNLFITALYNLAERCEYGTLHDNMIRDRIVVGIKDSSLSERMQLDDALILEKEKATKMVRQSGTMKLKQSEMRRLPNERSLEAIKMGRKVYRTRPQILVDRRPQKTPNYRSKENVCTKCGKSPPHGKARALQETPSATNVGK